MLARGANHDSALTPRARGSGIQGIPLWAGLRPSRTDAAPMARASRLLPPFGSTQESHEEVHLLGSDIDVVMKAFYLFPETPQRVGLGLLYYCMKSGRGRTTCEESTCGPKNRSYAQPLQIPNSLVFGRGRARFRSACESLN